MIGDTPDSVYKAILTQIDVRQCMLFLGSGSTRLCRDPNGKQGLDGNELAAEILKDLNHGVDPSFKTSLMEAAEFYSVMHPGQRGALDDFLQKRLRDLQPTIGHHLATTFPWRWS